MHAYKSMLPKHILISLSILAMYVHCRLYSAYTVQSTVHTALQLCMCLLDTCIASLRQSLHCPLLFHCLLILHRLVYYLPSLCL